MLASEFAEYRTGKTLTTYSFNGVAWATLKEAVHTRSGKQYACKIIVKEVQDRERLVHNEVTALQRIQTTSPNVLRMHRYVETAHDFRLYLDLCAGGSLAERIRVSGAYSEVKAADFIRTLLRAIKHVHNSGVVHRDLRPENLLFRTTDESAPIVITEFGQSRLVEEAPSDHHDIIEQYGSQSYLAPEILSNVDEHGAAVDVWQIGILTFFILTGGYTPFERETLELQRQAILTGEYRIPSNGKWESLSVNARRFVGICLTIDPDLRPTVGEILSHAWLVPPTVPLLRPKSRPSSVLDLRLPSSVRLPRFNPKRKWRIAGLTIQALNRMFFLTGHKPPVTQSPVEPPDYSELEETSLPHEAQIIIVEPKNEDENDCPSPAASSLFDRRSSLTISSAPTDEDESAKFSPRPISQEFFPVPEEDESAAQLDREASASAPDSLYTPETDGAFHVPGSSTSIPGDSDASPISTFVLFAPHELSDARAAVTLEDVRSLETDFPDGGTIVSVHVPTDAEAWVEAHFDDPELQSLRATGLRGPIAGMFSPEEPALILFGSILDEQVLHIAKALADVSGFVVMIRPIEHDPILKFLDHSNEPPSPTVSSPTDSDSEGEEFSARDDDETSPGLKHQSVNVSFGPASRLRGGHGEESTEYDSSVPWTSKAHKTVVWLRLWPDQKHQYPVSVRTRSKFTVRPPEGPDGQSLEEPEVIGHVHLTIETQAKVLPDRSYTSVGFLVYQQNAIIDREFMDCGFDYPDQTLKTVIQKSTQKNTEVTAGYTTLQPTAEVKLSYTKTRGRTVEYADNKPTPRCQIIHDPGERWNKDGKSYSSYDITTIPGQNPTTGHHHPLKAEYAMGINIHPNSENNRPRISFVTRNQVIVWISDSALKAKTRGVLILMATYIPDIRTQEALLIQEDLDIHFNENATPQSSPPQGTDANTTTAALSLSAAPISGKSGRNALLELFTDVRNRLNPPKEPTLANLFLREYISRGWDAGTQEWRSALWTSLDKDFRVTNLGHNSTNPVWKLGWEEQASLDSDSDGSEIEMQDVPSGSGEPESMGNDLVGTS